MQPGDSYEAPIYTAKQAFLAAVTTMENNHPNDWFTLVPLQLAAYRSTAHAWHTVRALQLRELPAGDELQLCDVRPLVSRSPPSMPTVRANNTEITPYDADPATGLIPSANFVDTPRADGDTCFAMALMLCLQPVRRHAVHGYDLEDLTSPRLPSPSRPAWRAAWDARGPRRSSSSRPTAGEHARQPPA